MKGLLEVDDSQTVVVRLENKFDAKTGKPEYRIGYRCWLAMQHETEAEWEAALQELKGSKKVKMMWPNDVNVKMRSAKETLRDLRGKSFDPIIVTIMSHGEHTVMKSKLRNLLAIDKTTPTRKDRRVIAKKIIDDDGSDIVAKKGKKKDQGKSKQPMKKKSDEEKKAALENLEKAKAKRRALLEVTNNVPNHKVLSTNSAELNENTAVPLVSNSDANEMCYDDQQPRSKEINAISKGPTRVAEYADEVVSNAKRPSCIDVAAVTRGVISDAAEVVSDSQQSIYKSDGAFPQGSIRENSNVNNGVQSDRVSIPCEVISSSADHVTNSAVDSLKLIDSSSSKQVDDCSNVGGSHNDLSDDEEGIQLTPKTNSVVRTKKRKRIMLLSESEDSEDEAPSVRLKRLMTEGRLQVLSNGLHTNLATSDDAVQQIEGQKSSKESQKFEADKDAVIASSSDDDSCETPMDVDVPIQDTGVTTMTPRARSSRPPATPLTPLVQVVQVIDTTDSQISDPSEVVNKDNELASAESYLTMGANELRIEFAKKLEEAKEMKNDLQKKSEEAAQWKLKYVQIKKGFERCKRTVIGSFDAPGEKLDTEDVCESQREISDVSSLSASASSPTNENGGKKRNLEKTQLPRATKPRKKFPLPTAFELEPEVMRICKDKERDVRAVASGALPLLFSEEVLRNSCIVGPRTRDPDSVPERQKPRGPPLDQQILNALLNTCHKIFTKKKSERRDPKWYTRFMSSAKYTMRKLRSKGGNAPAQDPLPNVDDAHEDYEKNMTDEDDNEEMSSDS
ncbi:hypothetical protein QAD02_000437 [Eretmocerus hayati]|uniref:Uncharacterized protein n=1 Tax=Eretmocerus hayati TaxID=131215 RepID=A0ACC2NE09_9HYME|nr:hypothetical protein QAD02_000437 [Eretmocerus hayati]